MKKKIIVVGAGPAGTMAAIQASNLGHKVTIFESMPKIARKLGISGKGRGNLTNSCEYKRFLTRFNNKGRFLKSTFKTFFNKELIVFFERIGVKTMEERGGRVFVASGRATDAVAALHKCLVQKNVDIRFNAPVKELIIENKHCVGVVSNGRRYKSDAVILATGGKSYPKTGSTGDGYFITENVGHSIAPLSPGLVPLICKEDLSTVKTVRLRNVKAALWVDGKKVGEKLGEVNFLDGELCGPAVIFLSKVAAIAMKKGKSCMVTLDLKPGLTHEQLNLRLLRDIKKKNLETLYSLMRGFLPKDFCNYFLNRIDLNSRDMISQLSKPNRMKIRRLLKELSFEISGHGGWDKAIVTSGGVKTTEVCPLTMRSKLIRNLYICGELLDIDACTGGYNLQAAFSTGYMAANNLH